ncbi:hypothetical protein MXB_755 [Myxobolus squamalis]|nr:hypothetical protein MXB_755 [Myxobolus squamalis]
MKFQVGIIGSGNWGSTVAKIIGENVAMSAEFESKVLMWVLEEVFQGEKLSHIINTRHENPKYLPGIRLPKNVVYYHPQSD